jgi:hypothetical protein
MKTKLTGLIAVIVIAAVFYSCKKTNCCTLTEETNTIVALKNGSEWRTEGFIYKRNSRKDTISITGNKDGEELRIMLKKTGDSYTMIDVRLNIVSGDIIWASYTFDTTKSNAFAITANTDALLEGNFTLNFNLNHDDASHPRPKTAVFKNGLFRINWDHAMSPVLWGVKNSI